MASSALKEGKRLEALVHFWNDLYVDPLDGSKLFDRRDTSAFEEGFGFFLLPSLKAYTEKLVYLKPSGENKVRAVSHGKLAAVLQLLGYETEAKEHWSEAAKLLKMPDSEVRVKFMDLIRKTEEGKQ
jgi:hypothetical protein